MSRKMKGSRQAGKSKEGAGENEVLRKQLREADDKQGGRSARDIWDRHEGLGVHESSKDRRVGNGGV